MITQICFVLVVTKSIMTGTYCPSANDFTVSYGSANIFNQGWTIHGGGGVASKATFNLLGGSIEYDIDLSQVNSGVNANLYSISPSIQNAGFTAGQYCDGSKCGNQWCVEIDWIESNGKCGGASTIHDIQGPGSNGCTSWGCARSYLYNGNTKFHMKISYDNNGKTTINKHGETFTSADFLQHHQTQTIQL